MKNAQQIQQTNPSCYRTASITLLLLRLAGRPPPSSGLRRGPRCRRCHSPQPLHHPPTTNLIPPSRLLLPVQWRPFPLRHLPLRLPLQVPIFLARSHHLQHPPQMLLSRPPIRPRPPPVRRNAPSEHQTRYGLLQHLNQMFLQ